MLIFTRKDNNAGDDVGVPRKGGVGYENNGESIN